MKYSTEISLGCCCISDSISGCRPLQNISDFAAWYLTNVLMGVSRINEVSVWINIHRHWTNHLFTLQVVQLLERRGTGCHECFRGSNSISPSADSPGESREKFLTPQSTYQTEFWSLSWTLFRDFLGHYLGHDNPWCKLPRLLFKRKKPLS